MKLIIQLESSPHGFDIMDSIYNALQDEGFKSDVMLALETAIEKCLGLRHDVSVDCKLVEIK